MASFAAALTILLGAIPKSIGFAVTAALTCQVVVSTSAGDSDPQELVLAT